jgi:hypothetical protein
MLKIRTMDMRTHYSTDEFIEWLGNSLKIHLDKACGYEYTNAHIEDLLINTDSFVSAVTEFISNCPKRG